MSEANVELVRAIHLGPDVDLVELFGRGGESNLLSAIEPLLDEGFEAVGHGGVRYGPFQGVDGLRRVWAEWLSPWESYRTETQEIVDLGDRVLVLVRDFGRRAGIEEEVSQHSASIWTVRAGKLARADFYADRTQALKAAGIRR